MDPAARAEATVMGRRTAVLLAILVAVLVAATPAGAQGGAPAVVATTPSPGSLEGVAHLRRSPDYTVSVAGRRSFVYASDNYWDHSGRRAQRRASWTGFDLAGGPVTVRITAREPVRSVTVRPRNDRVRTRVAGRTVSFRLSRPANLVVEINGDTTPLFVFADEPVRPDLGARYVFRRGVHRVGPRFPIAAGSRVYLAPGAVVEGTFELLGPDITIGGRGILSGGAITWERWLKDSSLSLLSNRENEVDYSGHRLSGVTLLNSPGWFKNGYGTHQAIRGVKMIGWVGNTDAIHLDGDSEMTDSFVFNNDDALITNHGSDNVYRNDVVSKGPWGRPMVSLQPSFAPQARNRWEDIDVIGNEQGNEWEGAMSIIEPGATRRSDYVFRDIRFEGPSAAKLVYLQAVTGNLISNFTFENITAEAQPALNGDLSAGRGGAIRGVTFRCIRSGGRVRTSLDDAGIRASGPVSGVSFAGCS